MSLLAQSLENNTSNNKKESYSSALANQNAKHVHVEWGRRKKQCHGNGVCVIIVDDGPHCLVSNIKDSTKKTEKNNTDAWFTLKNKVLELYFYYPVTKFTNLVIDEKLKVDFSDEKKKLAKELFIKSGSYSLTYLKDGVGKVSFKTE
jgi:hypothetical protein